MMTSSEYYARPTFFVRNFPIRAVGVLFFRRTETGVDFLFMRRRPFHDEPPTDWLYEDFGGKTDAVDKTVIDTAAREVDEESNHAFNMDWLKEQLFVAKWRGNYFINGRSKYIVFIVPVPEDLDLTVFGDMEAGTNYRREVLWVSQDQIMDLTLHPRLRTPYIWNGLRKVS